jgi:hypothetical protein
MNDPSTRQRPLFHDGPDWLQLQGEIRNRIVDQLAEMCLEILTAGTSDRPDSEERDDATED